MMESCACSAAIQDAGQWARTDTTTARLAPTAVLGSIAFAPEIVIPTIRELHRRYGTYIYSEYGFLDAFNPSFDFDVPLVHGRCIEGFGWVASDYLGIDQGPIIAMIENGTSELVWRVMRKNPLPAPRPATRRFQRRMARDGNLAARQFLVDGAAPHRVSGASLVASQR